MLKFQSAVQIIKNWPIAKKSNSLYSVMVANVPIKFDWDQTKTAGQHFWNLQPNTVLC